MTTYHMTYLCLCCIYLDARQELNWTHMTNTKLGIYQAEVRHLSHA